MIDGTRRIVAKESPCMTHLYSPKASNQPVHPRPRFRPQVLWWRCYLISIINTQYATDDRGLPTRVSKELQVQLIVIVASIAGEKFDIVGGDGVAAKKKRRQRTRESLGERQYLGRKAVSDELLIFQNQLRGTIRRMSLADDEPTRFLLRRNGRCDPERNPAEGTSIS